ncbi:MAG: LysR family transcriptional regulator [Nannocystales bacterium]
MPLPGRNDVRWDDLKLFLALTRAETLAGASAQLGIHASTVFRRIGLLEELLGTRLFDRLATGHALTAAGSRLIEYAERIEDEALAATRALAGGDFRLRGTVRLATTDTVAVRLLGAPLEQFRSAHPEIIVELLIDNRPVHLGRGEAELAVRPGPHPGQDDVIATEAARLGSGFFASKRYLQRCGKPASRRRLQCHEFVSVDSSLSSLSYAKFLTDHFPEASIVYRSNTLLALAAAVEAGIGIGLLPCFLFAGRQDVERLFAPVPELQTPLWLLVHVDLRRTARVQALKEHLLAWTTRHSAALLSGAAIRPDDKIS